MAKLESLLVDLQVNTAELRRGLDEAKGHLKGFGDHIKEIGEKIHSLTEMAAVEMTKQFVEKFGEFVLKGAEAAEMMGKLAQATGLPLETFSQLNYAANLTGISTEEFGKALEKLDKSMGLAAAGATEQSALFRALGVSVTEASGKVRHTDDVLGELADKFAAMPNSAAKTTLAMELFGKAGAQLIPFLNEGRDGLQELKDEASSLGVTLDSETGAATKEFNDNLHKLQAVLSSVAMHVAGELAPAMTKLTNELLHSKTGAEFLKGAVDTLVAAFKGLLTAGVIIGAVLEAVGKTIAAIASAVMSLLDRDFGAAKAAMSELGHDLVDLAVQAKNRVKDIWVDSGKSTEEGAKKHGDIIDGLAERTLKNFERMKKAPEEYKKAMEALNRVLDDLGKKQAELADGHKDPVAEMQYRLENGDLAKDLAKIGAQAEVMKGKILDAVKALQALELHNKKIEIEFQLKQNIRETDREVTNARLDYGNLGDPTAQWKKLTAGFDDFESAISGYADAAKEHASWVAAAGVAEARGLTDAARGANTFADEASRTATKALDAARAFQDLQKTTKEMEKSFGGLMGLAIFKAAGGSTPEQLNASNALGNHFAGKMGETGQVVDSALQGFQAGGIWGAIIAALAELLTNSTQFQGLIDTLNKVLKDLGDALGPALATIQEAVDGGLKPLSKSIGDLLSAIIGLLNTLHGVGHIKDALAPLVNIVKDVLQPIMIIVKALTQLIDSIGIWDYVVKAISAILNFVSLTILDTVMLLEMVWQGILKLVIGFLHAIHADASGVEKLYNENAANIKAIQDKMTHIWNNMFDPHAGDDTEPSKPIYDPHLDGQAQRASIPVGKLGDAANGAANAIDKMTGQLTNVPQGFRIALARYKSTAPELQGDLTGRNGPVNIHISGGVMTTLDQLADAVQRAMLQKKFQKTGFASAG